MSVRAPERIETLTFGSVDRKWYARGSRGAPDLPSRFGSIERQRTAACTRFSTPRLSRMLEICVFTVLADEQALGDFRVLEPLREQVEDLALPLGEVIQA